MDFVTMLIIAGVAGCAFAGTYMMMHRRRRSETERREDVLKQVYHLREKQREVTLASVSGALHVPQDRITGIISSLSEEGLIDTNGESLRLTEDGTTAALKLVRSHRLWERYLADETGVRDVKWHREAEKQEHRLTAEEADALSRRLGNPMYDPHGDPIPQKDLELPQPRGISLSSAEPGKEYTVVHLEDEPAAVYNELVSSQVFRGSRVRILGKDTSNADILSDGKEVRLSLLALANVTVVPARERVASRPSGRTLGDLKAGEEARVQGLSPACRGMQRRRLLDLGVLPGTTIRAEIVSPLGDPTGYRIRGSLVALRKTEASLVNVEGGAA